MNAPGGVLQEELLPEVFVGVECEGGFGSVAEGTEGVRVEVGENFENQVIGDEGHWADGTGARGWKMFSSFGDGDRRFWRKQGTLQIRLRDGFYGAWKYGMKQENN